MAQLPMLIRKGQRVWVWLDLSESHPLYYAQFLVKEHAIAAMRSMQDTKHYHIDDEILDEIMTRAAGTFR